MLTYAKVHISDFNPMEVSMKYGDVFFSVALDTREGAAEVVP